MPDARHRPAQIPGAKISVCPGVGGTSCQTRLLKGGHLFNGVWRCRHMTCCSKQTTARSQMIRGSKTFHLVTATIGKLGTMLDFATIGVCAPLVSAFTRS